jgi:glutathione peroxidase
MSRVFLFILFLGIACQLKAEQETNDPEGPTSTVLNRKMKSLDGKETDLTKYLGKVVVIVNVASECGLTPQYEQLQALHEKYAEKGLAVLGFPCNQFGSQEPGSNQEIQAFCTKNYGVKFDMFSKIEVNGTDACDLYKDLTKLATKPEDAGDISWNFEKFVLDRRGKVVARFSPKTRPDAPEIVKLIESSIGENGNDDDTQQETSTN